jgi:homoserine dehydrogenase
MIGEGKAYEQALAEAQEQGYAEADPTLDVNGGDTAHKLAVLASMAFGVQVTDEQVPCRGIDTLDLADVRFGQELGYVVKLLAIAERNGKGLALSVSPCFVHSDEPLASVGGSFNAVSVFGDAVGHTMFYGRGAGQMPTASAVMGDVIDIACGAYPQLFANLHLWADQHEAVTPLDPGEIEGRFYLRINALDVPGVVAKFSAILGEANIGIAGVRQHEVAAGQFVPVVVVTHRASASAMNEAVKRIAALKEIEGQPQVLRIIDMPEG